MKFKAIYFIISALVIIPGVISLARYGLKPSIDFTGGSLLELKVLSEEKIDKDAVSQTIPEDIVISAIQTSGENTYLIRTETIDKNQAQTIKDTIAENIGQTDEIRFETVGPTIGNELLRKTLISIGLASVAIMLFVMYRFRELKYGVCAILAMFHDTLILIGSFSLLGHFLKVEVDTLFVTAVLTTLSFSVHDTIVVYDRIRESLRDNPKVDFVSVVNKSIAETLGRSINNSMTIIFMLLALWLLGGETTKWFVFALLIGTVAGTYSSTFTASPLLVVWESIKSRKRKTLR